MIYKHIRVTGTHETVLDFSDLFSITLSGDDVQGYDTRWDEVLFSTHDVPADNVLESLCKMRIRWSDQLQTVLAFFEQDIQRNDAQPSCQKWKNMVKNF